MLLPSTLNIGVWSVARPSKEQNSVRLSATPAATATGEVAEMVSLYRAVCDETIG